MGKHLKSQFIALPLLILGMAIGQAAEPADHRISAGKGPYFFCDPRVIEDRWQVERFVCPPRRHSNNPVMTRAFPWEGTGPHLAGSVIKDPQSNQWKMWYSVFNQHAYENRLPFSYNVCLATSDDGLNWNRPPLGVFEYEGRTDNNGIRLGTDKTQNIDVCLNPHPERWPGKYLSIHNQKGGIFVSHSDDGQTFTRLFPQPALAYHSDTHNNLVYDDVRDRWLLYCRPRAWVGYHKRRVALQTSSDLEHWSHDRTILLPTESEIPEYYGMTVFRRGDLFFGAVQIYEHHSGAMHLELAWSDDGEHWLFLPSHPTFLERGPAGSWEAGMVLVAENPVEVGNELWFYYSGFPLDHNSKTENVAAIGLAVADRDRLIGLRPNSIEPGLLMTRPFSLHGRQIELNTVVRGEILAELRTDGNKVIPGYSYADSIPITESGFNQVVRWKGKLAEQLPEDDVRLLLKFADAELFSFDLSAPKP